MVGRPERRSHEAQRNFQKGQETLSPNTVQAAGSESDTPLDDPQCATVRQRIVQLLQRNALTARELSQALHISEKDLYQQLPHLQRSLAARGQQLVADACECLACGHRFEGRRRFPPPSRCPRCHAERLRRPSYRIA